MFCCKQLRLYRFQQFSTFRWCSQVFDQIEKESRRKIKISLFQDALKQAQEFKVKEEFIRFTLCDVNSQSQLIEAAVPANVLYSAIAQTYNLEFSLVERLYGEINSMNNFEDVFNAHKKSTSIQFSSLFQKIQEIFELSGGGCEEQKEVLVKDLLSLCSSAQEVKYLIRFLKKRMRIGLSTQSVSQLLDESERKRLLGYQSGSGDLQKGIPIQPQLAKSFQKENKEEEITMEKIKKKFLNDDLGGCYFEYKYDGERLQVHYTNGEVKLFGRSLEEKTNQFKELSNQLKGHFDNNKFDDVILDCEMICYHNGEILPFQEMQNKTYENSVYLSLVCFDILYHNKQILLNKTYSQRLQIYNSILKPITKQRQVISHIISHKFANENEMDRFYKQALLDGLEGIMIKRDTFYTPGSRNDWLKIKKEKDIDLVVLGGYYGQGKRQQWLGSFLLGIYENGRLHPIAKIGTGFSDQKLEELTKRYMSKPSGSCPSHLIGFKDQPHVWFSQNDVWEVTYDTVSASPLYPAQNSQLNTGISVRFPRFKRERPDKTIEQSGPIQDLVEEYFKVQKKEFL
ncbi:unnamed protein product (macronuclear) [Paramecium tetraurelia]|uniref:DNA ligase 1 n=1 Tax=Paramecium tetraurelia TaxID=5888 RepID=A0BMP6_PARTE|nr:uncharacterized protein GSPATT00030449001 [Paramecium tetraurelia]CAK59813.1 unnamed protein product [Paramecium tetraurelia]|eukprot:XP_001427211.1 hypothetical protein (macronuclear) [Paramecium tetraurelia strain d4-2]